MDCLSLQYRQYRKTRARTAHSVFDKLSPTTELSVRRGLVSSARTNSVPQGGCWSGSRERIEHVARIVVWCGVHARTRIRFGETLACFIPLGTVMLHEPIVQCGTFFHSSLLWMTTGAGTGASYGSAPRHTHDRLTLMF